MPNPFRPLGPAGFSQISWINFPGGGQVLERLLGLRINLRDVYSLASRDSILGPLVQGFEGLKPPRSPTVFESAVSAIACQQTKLTHGIRLLNDLAESCGLAMAEDGIAHAFPRPEDLVALGSKDPYKLQTIRSMGFKFHQADSIFELARSMVVRDLDLESITTLTDEEALARLVALPGVNRWTAECVLLRGMGRLDVFPADDVDARKSLQRWLHLPKPVGHADVGHIRRPWKPYAGLIYFYLLLSAGVSKNSS
jgi:DNA-3-methyladenine glycosylase II